MGAAMRRPPASTAILAALTVVATACASVPSQGAAPNDQSTSGAEPSSAPVAEDPVVVAAGDIACPDTHPAFNGGEGTATQCRHRHTSELITGADRVFVLGNAQYPTGSRSQYRAVYEPTWGRQKAITEPTPGEHDYSRGDASGYLEYFGVAEYHSFDLGSWHWVSLNSEIPHGADSPQLQWLQEDLARTSQPCIGAFWSDSAFSSGADGNDPDLRPLWDALYAVGADVVLSAESRHYERFAKQAPDGTAADDGVRQFVVGTGGFGLTEIGPPQPNSEVRASVFGVLQLRLGAADYSWQFLTEPGGTFSDTGSTACNP